MISMIELSCIKWSSETWLWSSTGGFESVAVQVMKNLDFADDEHELEE